MDSDSPYLSWKYFKKYKKNRESSQKVIIFSYLNFLELQNVDFFGPMNPHIFLNNILVIPLQNTFQFQAFLEGVSFE